MSSGPDDRPDTPAPSSATAPIYEDDFDLLLEQLLALSSFDFDRRLPLDRGTDSFRALALGLNMLTEELQSVLRSREKAEALWDKIFEMAPIGLTISSPDGVLTAVNEVFAKMLGRTVDELIGSRWQSLTHPDDLERERELEAEIFAGKVGSIELEKRYLTKSGAPIWVRLLGTVVRDAAGEIDYSISQIVDIDEQKKTAEALRIARDRALASDRMKTEFLRNVSHEIRTPMTTIIGMTELVLGTHLEPEQRDYLQLVRSAGTTLIELVDDILSLSKIDSGGFDPDMTALEPATVLREVLEPLRASAGFAGLDFHVHLPTKCPEVISDRGWLSQIVTNLVGNAIKFTAEGSVTVRLRLDRDGDSALMTVSVTDTGIGIDEDHSDLIFAPFSQADGSVTRKYGGSGLGLAIAQRLAQLLGGEIEVESVSGAGSTFQLTLPVEIASGRSVAAAADASTPTTTLDGLRVLVVDDQDEHRAMIGRVLDQRGCVVRSAGNGREAVDTVAEWPCDLVLMDIQMPEMDGLEAISALRKLERSSSERLPIVVVTAHAAETDKALAFNAGADGFITKPFTADGLVEAVVDATGWAERADG